MTRDLIPSLLGRASSVNYDNSSSGLSAKNVQNAIDELTVSIGAGKPFTSLTDPALNSITQSMVDTKGGVVITLTAAGNDQTLPTPTDISIAHQFVVINNDTSTNNIDIIGGVTVTLQPGEKVDFIYDGTAWIASEASGLWLDDGTNLTPQDTTRNVVVSSGKIGIGTTTPQTTLDVNGSVSMKRTVTGAADYNPSILTDDYLIAVTDTSVARQVIISTEDIAVGSTSRARFFVIKDESGAAGTNNITVSGETGTIDGGSSISISGNGDALTVYSNGTNLFAV